MAGIERADSITMDFHKWFSGRRPCGSFWVPERGGWGGMEWVWSALLGGPCLTSDHEWLTGNLSVRFGSAVPYDCGAVLVRDGAVHEKAFTLDAGYLHASQRGVSGHYAFTPWHHTTQLSRGNRALKVWMMIKAYGINKVRVPTVLLGLQSAIVGDWCVIGLDCRVLLRVASQASLANIGSHVSYL